MKHEPFWDAPPEHSHLVIWRIISCLFVRRDSWLRALRTGSSGCAEVAEHLRQGRECRRTAVTSDQVLEEEEVLQEEANSGRQSDTNNVLNKRL